MKNLLTILIVATLLTAVIISCGNSKHLPPQQFKIDLKNKKIYEFQLDNSKYQYPYLIPHIVIHDKNYFKYRDTGNGLNAGNKLSEIEFFNKEDLELQLTITDVDKNVIFQRSFDRNNIRICNWREPNTTLILDYNDNYNLKKEVYNIILEIINPSLEFISDSVYFVPFIHTKK
ncbi:MAG: hypothetical protein WC868_08725 [Bacteroidales bacterium]